MEGQGVMTARVETRIVFIRGERLILLQLPTGFVVISSTAARQIAGLLLDQAIRLEAEDLDQKGRPA
jgi:hypothetical protein